MYDLHNNNNNKPVQMPDNLNAVEMTVEYIVCMLVCMHTYAYIGMHAYAYIATGFTVK